MTFILLLRTLLKNRLKLRVFWLCVDEDEICYMSFNLMIVVMLFCCVACGDLDYCLLCCLCIEFDEEGKCF